MEVNKSNPKLIWRLRVPSKSHPGTFHTLEIYDSGDMRCPCWANKHGKICSHMKKTIVYIKVLLDKMKELYGERLQNDYKDSKKG